jgi:hypothetical protein
VQRLEVAPRPLRHLGVVAPGVGHLPRVDGDREALDVVELAQLGRGERGLGGAAAPAHHDLAHRRRAQRLDGVVGGVGGPQVGLGEQQHPCDVEGDVAVADHDGALGGEVGIESDVVGVAVVPTDEVDRGEAAREVLARDPEAALGLRADRVEHRVVALEQLVARHVLAEVDVPEEPEAGAGGDLLVLVAHRLDLRVVGGDARADQTPRRGEPVEHVHAHLGLGRVEQGPCCVEARGARTDDGHGVSPHGCMVAHDGLACDPHGLQRATPPNG